MNISMASYEYYCQDLLMFSKATKSDHERMYMCTNVKSNKFLTTLLHFDIVDPATFCSIKLRNITFDFSKRNVKYDKYTICFFTNCLHVSS